MRHTDAIRDNAVERYLLGEMTEDEQGIFEEHYFDCRLCAAEVTDGTRMMIAGRTVALEPVEPDVPVEDDPPPSNVLPMPPRPVRWFPAAAAASLIFGLLGSGAGYRLALQMQRATTLVRVVQLDTGVSRAGTPAEVPTLRAGDELRFDVEPADEAVRYAAVVHCGGKTQSRHDVSREMAADAISLRLGELPAGRCDLVIEGVREDGKRFEITRSPFKVGER